MIRTPPPGPSRVECLAHVDQLWTGARSIPAPHPIDEDDHLLAALLRGDESAFVTLVDQYHASLVRLAMAYVHDRAVAEDVAQDAWLGVLRGIRQFAYRSSLKTWILRILINTAKRRALREKRCIPFSAWEGEDPFEPAVAAERFRGDSDQWPGGWASAPASWSNAPEDRLLSAEVQHHIRAAIDRLPANQRDVIVMRDVQGFTSADVCNALELSDANQRVLLHRARSKVRQALEGYFSER